LKIFPASTTSNKRGFVKEPKDYQGARTGKAIVDSCLAEIPNHVTKVVSSGASGKSKTVDDFLGASPTVPKSLLFTTKTTTAPLIKALALDFLNGLRGSVLEGFNTMARIVAAVRAGNYDMVYLHPLLTVGNNNDVAQGEGLFQINSESKQTLCSVCTSIFAHVSTLALSDKITDWSALDNNTQQKYFPVKIFGEDIPCVTSLQMSGPSSLAFVLINRCTDTVSQNLVLPQNFVGVFNVAQITTYNATLDTGTNSRWLECPSNPNNFPWNLFPWSYQVSQVNVGNKPEISLILPFVTLSVISFS